VSCKFYETHLTS